jgi:hypothetical protein
MRGFPPEAFEPLTTGELNRLSVVLPRVIRALEHKGYTPQPDTGVHDLVGFYFQMVGSLHGVRSLPRVVRGAGWSWRDFEVTMLRIAAALAASNYRLNSRHYDDLAEKLNGKGSPVDPSVLKLSQVASLVPEANIRLLHMHLPELSDLWRLFPGQPRVRLTEPVPMLHQDTTPGR